MDMLSLINPHSIGSFKKFLLDVTFVNEKL